MKKFTRYKKNQIKFIKYLFYRSLIIKKVKDFYRMNLLVNHFFKKNFGLNTKYKKLNFKSKFNKKFHQFSYFLENKVDRIFIKVSFFSKLSLLNNFFKQDLIKLNNVVIHNTCLLNVNDILTLHPLLFNFINKLFNLKKNMFYRYNYIYGCYLKKKIKFNQLVFCNLYHSNLIVNYKYFIIICTSNIQLPTIKNQSQLNEFNNFYLK
jgi:hypothetical protein